MCPAVCVCTRGIKCSPLPLCFSTRSPKDSTDEFNLSKTDLNVFLLPSTVCGRQHRLQEPEERWPWLLKVLQATPGAPSLAWPPAAASSWTFPLNPCEQKLLKIACDRRLVHYFIIIYNMVCKLHCCLDAAYSSNILLWGNIGDENESLTFSATEIKMISCMNPSVERSKVRVWWITTLMWNVELLLSQISLFPTHRLPSVDPFQHFTLLCLYPFFRIPLYAIDLLVDNLLSLHTCCLLTFVHDLQRNREGCSDLTEADICHRFVQACNSTWLFCNVIWYHVALK